MKYTTCCGIFIDGERRPNSFVDRMGHIRRRENQNSIGRKSLRRPVETQLKICQVFDHFEEIERIDELLSNVVNRPVMIRLSGISIFNPE